MISESRTTNDPAPDDEPTVADPKVEPDEF